MLTERHLEVLAAVDDDAGRLIDEHKARRQHWYFHEYVPWERGESYQDKPWDASQCTISEDARAALAVNLLTEDNLPYYHEVFGKSIPRDSQLAGWGHIWTAEENQHSIAMRSYLAVSRNCDPRQLEDDRMATMITGWDPHFGSPAELFSYTSFQELATRVSHRNAGKLADDESAFQIMKQVAQDENHHFIFYKSMLAALLREDPTDTLAGIYYTLTHFQMPGFAMPRFLRRSVQIAKAGIYNLRLHHDRVVVPVLRDWGVGSLTGLDAEGQKYQDLIMAYPTELLEQAEKFESRNKVTTID